jgi:hypothetical protein
MLLWITTTQLLLWLGLAHAAEHNSAPLTSLPIALVLVLGAVIQLPIVTAILAGMPPVSVRRMSRGSAAVLATVAAAGISFGAAAQAEQLIPAARIVNALHPGPITTVDRVVAADRKADRTANGRRDTPSPVPDESGSERGRGRTDCTPQTSQASRTFLDREFEDTRYVIAFTKTVTFCASPKGGIRLVDATTTPVLVDSSQIRLSIDSQESVLSECGRGCIDHTTVLRGTARRGSGVALATAQATIRTRISQAGTTTHSSIEYRVA